MSKIAHSSFSKGPLSKKGADGAMPCSRVTTAHLYFFVSLSESSSSKNFLADLPLYMRSAMVSEVVADRIFFFFKLWK